jgi:hypothetical protein
MEDAIYLAIEYVALDKVKEEVEENSREEDQSYDEDGDGKIISK